MGISAGIGASALIAAGTTAYSVHSSKQAQEAEENQANQQQAAALAEAQAISTPNTSATAATLKAGEQRAASAGGTITTPGQGAQQGLIGDGGNNVQRKTLLGA